MTDKKNGGKDGNGDNGESIAELADRLGLRDAEGKLDLEAAGKVAKSDADAKAAHAKAEAEAKKAAEPKPAEPAAKK
jgi:hypothetical protein